MKNNKETIFGVDILEHLQKQLKRENLTEENKRDLISLIKHLESGKRYQDYKGT